MENILDPETDKHREGGSKCPQLFRLLLTAIGAYKSNPDFLSFPIYLLTKDLTKKI